MGTANRHQPHPGHPPHPKNNRDNLTPTLTKVKTNPIPQLAPVKNLVIISNAMPIKTVHT